MPFRSRSSRRRLTRFASVGVAAAVVLGGVTAAALGASAAPVRTHTAVHGWPAAPTSVASGGTYRASLRVSGGARTVRLERLESGTWTVLDRERTTSAGRTTLTWKVPSTTTKAVLRVHVIHTARHTNAITRQKTVTVRTTAVEALRAQLLTLVNRARATARTCGSTSYPAVPALHRSAALDTAAGGYATAMATRDFFSHTSPSGSTMVSRLAAVGITNTTERENIAAGQTSAASVMAAWLASPGHCANLMAGDVTRIGFGHATSSTSTYGQYWVQDLAG